jgi:uncharacterized protein (UPF0297 family)
MVLAQEDREAFRREAYRRKLGEGELLEELVKRYLADRGRSLGRKQEGARP